MTRDVGQLTATKTVAGLLLVVAVASTVIRGLDLLIDVQEVELEAPAENVARTCEDLPADLGTVEFAVTSSELIECPRLFDGQRVSYTGEVVRAVLKRSERAWVQINDDPYGLAIGPLPEHRTTVGGNSGIPVSIPRRVADAITYVGDHTHLGDVLAVRGVFRRADPADGGGPTITAESVTIARVGRTISSPLPLERLVIAAALMLAAGAFFALGGGLARIARIRWW